MAAQPWRTGKIIRIENETASCLLYTSDAADE